MTRAVSHLAFFRPLAGRPATLIAWLLAAATMVLCAPDRASAQLLQESLPETEGVGVEPRLGEIVPGDIILQSWTGAQVKSEQFFDGKRPVLLVLAYYDCPMLCTLVMNKVQESLNEMDWTAGDEFRVVTVSFDHRDTPEKARQQRDAYLAGYDRTDLAPDAWMYFTGDATNVRRLCESVGFRYRYLPEVGEFSHPAAIFFLRPDGTVQNFIEGLEYPASHVKLALFEASEGKAGTVFDRIVLTCYRYDPKTGQYIIAPMQVMRLGAIATMAFLVVSIGSLAYANHRRKAAGRGVHESHQVRFSNS